MNSVFSFFINSDCDSTESKPILVNSINAICKICMIDHQLFKNLSVHVQLEEIPVKPAPKDQYIFNLDETIKKKIDSFYFR